MRQLAKDDKFLVETTRLKRKFERVLPAHPEAIKKFFRKYSDPTIFPYRLIRELLDGMNDRALRSLYESYCAYVFRFGVYFDLRAKERKPFKARTILPWGGSKFHVSLVGETLQPARAYPGIYESDDSLFESDKVEVTAPLEKLIASGHAKFVRIDDESWSSILSKLERFAYDPKRITFLLHKAQQPYLFCLVGEMTQTEDWRRASTAVIAFLQEHFHRGKKGRRVDILRFRKALKLQEQPGPLKVKAEKLERGKSAKDAQTAQAYAIRVAKLTK